MKKNFTMSQLGLFGKQTHLHENDMACELRLSYKGGANKDFSSYMPAIFRTHGIDWISGIGRKTDGR
jgi:hypothetical protein